MRSFNFSLAVFPFTFTVSDTVSVQPAMKITLVKLKGYHWINMQNLKDGKTLQAQNLINYGSGTPEEEKKPLVILSVLL